MEVTEKLRLTWEEFEFCVLMDNMYLFMLTFWADDIKLPPSRTDLPKHYHEYDFVISVEQIFFWQDESQNMLVCTSRKIFKTGYLEAFNIRECITYTGEGTIEAMFFAPGEHQIKPVVNRLKSKVKRVPLFALFLGSWNDSTGIVNWRNNVVLHIRIEGRQGGQNMVGLRARLYMVGDEMAYGSQAAHDERQNTSTPECRIILCGVPNGVRHTPFYRLDQTSLGSGFKHHKYMITANPMYHSRAALRSELKKHGDDPNSQSWRTQVLGEWGAETETSFPVIPIMDKYFFRTYSFTAQDLEPIERIADSVRLPRIKALRWMICGDIGYSPSPTELGIFAEIEEEVWYQATRITLMRISMPTQAAIIDLINRHVLPVPAACIGIDAHGQGSGLLQSLHSDLMITRYGWYDYKNFAFDVGFAGTVEQKSIFIHKSCGKRVRFNNDVYYCDDCKVPVWSPDELAHPKIQAKQAYTIELKSALESGMSWLRVESGEVVLTKDEDGVYSLPEGAYS